MNVPTEINLIETMYRSVDGHISRIELHLERLSQSANALDITCDLQTIRRQLDTLPAYDDAQRVRLEMSANAKVTINTYPFVATDPNKIWTLAIASTRLDSTDTLLQHKTTNRGQYVLARQEFNARSADEVLLLNEREELCEGTISNIFLETTGERPLLTPALQCGLLRGVLRQELLDQGRAREAILTPADLVSAKAIFIGNSLRGLMQARYVE